MNLYSRATIIGLQNIKDWLKPGRNGGDKYVTGDITVNLNSGFWISTVDSNIIGEDTVSLYAFKNKKGKAEAAQEILTRYDAEYQPDPFDDFTPEIRIKPEIIDEDVFGPAASALEKLERFDERKKISQAQELLGISGLYASNKPTALLEQNDQNMVEKIASTIYYPVKNKEGEIVPKLYSDWNFKIIDVDPAIRDCLKFDYTTGNQIMYYENTEIFDAALHKRLIADGVPANAITETKRKELRKRILHNNSNYNSVAEFIDVLKGKHKNTDDSILDEFLNLLEYDYVKSSNDIDEEKFSKECDLIDRVYRELFDKFLLRMHIHVNGTRRKPNGEYYGLLENDIVPILEGGQDIGKTSLCRWLACDDYLYVDLGSGSKSGFGTADTVRKVRGKLIAELGEMKITKREEDIEQVKSFISAKQYEHDHKFVEFSKPLPATVSFIGTSNPSQYLTDETGNRRHYPVHLKTVNKNALTDNKELSEKLHAHYARKAEASKDIFKDLKWTEEFKIFMEQARRDALITYSDYEVVVALIPDWIKKEKKIFVQNYEIKNEIHRREYDHIRITDKGIRKAMEESGFSYIKKRIRNATVWGWVSNVPPMQIEPPQQKEVPF